MLTPRLYLSFSQMILFEMSPEKYADQYLFGKNRESTGTWLMGACLRCVEAGEWTSDPLLDLNDGSPSETRAYGQIIRGRSS